MRNASEICLRLDRQEMERAFSRACAKTGKRMAARMAMIAMTTSSSISVKPADERRDPKRDVSTRMVNFSCCIDKPSKERENSIAAPCEDAAGQDVLTGQASGGP